jgi:hypothetical protein
MDQGSSMIANSYQSDFAANSGHIQSATAQLQAQYNIAEELDQRQGLATNIQNTQGVLESMGIRAQMPRQLNLGGLNAFDAKAALSAAFMSSLDSDDPQKVIDIFGSQYQNAIRAGLKADDIKNAINTVIAHKFGGGGGGAAPLLEVTQVRDQGMYFKKGRSTKGINYL